MSLLPLLNYFLFDPNSLEAVTGASLVITAMIGTVVAGSTVDSVAAVAANGVVIALVSLTLTYLAIVAAVKGTLNAVETHMQGAYGRVGGSCVSSVSLRGAHPPPPSPTQTPSPRALRGSGSWKPKTTAGTRRTRYGLASRSGLRLPSSAPRATGATGSRRACGRLKGLTRCEASSLGGRAPGTLVSCVFYGGAPFLLPHTCAISAVPVSQRPGAGGGGAACLSY